MNEKTSTKTITVKTWVTTRNEWTPELVRQVQLHYEARGHVEINGRHEWKYFDTLQSANEWCDSFHEKD